MAVITVTANRVQPLKPHVAEIHDWVAAETITAGQVVYQDSAGRAALAAGGAAGTAKAIGIALQGGTLGSGISVLKRGHVAGFTISQAYNATVFVSNTTGAVDDAAGTTTFVLGRVVSLPDDPTFTKVLYIDVPYGA